MKRTLIIHPDDRSTDFLKPIYGNVGNATVITGGFYKDEVDHMIEEHDQVMMMGHGSPWGLFAMGKFKSSTNYIVDMDTVRALSKKDNNVFVWCNADQFVNRHNLKGFYSGMFISEVGEATYCGLPETTQNLVDESNNKFAQLLGEVAGESIREAYNHIIKSYGVLTENNAVAKYNHERIYIR